MMLVALCSFAWPPATEARRTFAPPGLVGDAVVEDGAVYYRSFTRRREVVKRLDLETGKRRVVYGHALEPFSISGIRAGGGRVVIEVSAPREEDFVSRVLEIAPGGGDPTLVVEKRLVTRDNEGDCGGLVVLKDVGPNGEILTEEGTAPCEDPREGFATLKVYAGGSPREIGRHGVEDVFDLVDGPARKLASGRLLTWTDTRATVTELATGSTRRVARRGRRWLFQDVDLDSAGDVLATEFIFGRGRRYREAVRLVRPTDRSTGGKLLFRSRRGFEVAGFCGEALAEYSLSGRGVERLRLRPNADSAPRLLHRGKPPTKREFSFEFACDESAFALLRSIGDPERTRIETFSPAPNP